MPEDSFFSDLPNEGEGAAPPAVVSEENKEQETERLRNIEKAKKQEKSRLEKEQAELDELRKKRKEAREAKQKLEKGEEEPTEDVLPETGVKQSVEEVLRERDEAKRKGDIASLIRRTAKTRQEAEAINAEALRLPSDWSIEEVVSVAADRVQNVRQQQRGFVSPSLSGGGYQNLQSPQNEFGEMSNEGREWLKQNGVTPEDHKRLSDERGYYPALGKELKKKYKLI